MYAIHSLPEQSVVLMLQHYIQGSFYFDVSMRFFIYVKCPIFSLKLPIYKFKRFLLPVRQCSYSCHLLILYLFWFLNQTSTRHSSDSLIVVLFRFYLFDYLFLVFVQIRFLWLLKPSTEDLLPINKGALHLRRLASNGTGKLGNAFLRYHNR